MHNVSGNIAGLGLPLTKVIDTFFLPDFCRVRMIFAVVLLAELFSFVLVTTKSGNSQGLWAELALVSLFVQWVALTSAGLLCIGRPWLSRRNATLAGILGGAMVVLVTGIATALAAKALRQPLNWQPFVQNLTVSTIITAALFRYFYLQYRWKQRLQIESEARLQALQSQIRPHFLFNSMNTIASLTRSQPDLAEQVVEDLADLFRACLSDARIPSTFQAEFATCRQYLRIEALRFGDRLNAKIELDHVPGNALLPRLSLQPLVENAIHHGIEPSPEGGTVRIAAQHTGNQITVLIENSLPRSSSLTLREGNRMALENVSQRLEAFFGCKVAMESIRTRGHYQLKLCLPLVTHAS